MNLEVRQDEMHIRMLIDRFRENRRELSPLLKQYTRLVESFAAVCEENREVFAVKMRELELMNEELRGDVARLAGV